MYRSARRRRSLAAAALASVTVVLLVACSSDPEPGDTTPPGEASPTADTSPPGDGELGEASADGFYSGATIEILIPNDPGGSVDGSARLVGQYLTQYVDGHPTVVPINLAGGGGMQAPNEFALQRPADGMTVLMMGLNSLGPAILGDPAAQYDLSTLRPLWGALGPRFVYASPDIGITPDNIEDLADPPVDLYYGAVNASGIDSLATLIKWEALGTLDKISTVFGYEGGSAISAAFDAGELNLNAQGAATVIRNEMESIEAGEKVLLYTQGIPDMQGGLERDPLLPEIPHVGEVYERIYGTAPSGEAWEAFMTLAEISVAGAFTIWIHGDAPPEAISALEEGVARMMADPEFAAASEPFAPYPQMYGDELVAWADAAANPDPAVMDWVATFLFENYGIQLAP